MQNKALFFGFLAGLLQRIRTYFGVEKAGPLELLLSTSVASDTSRLRRSIGTEAAVCPKDAKDVCWHYTDTSKQGIPQHCCIRLQHFSSMPSHDHALLIREQTGYSWYDSLIVAAAVEAESSWLITEDLEHGRKFGSLTSHNPFR